MAVEAALLLSLLCIRNLRHEHSSDKVCGGRRAVISLSGWFTPDVSSESTLERDIEAIIAQWVPRCVCELRRMTEPPVRRPSLEASLCAEFCRSRYHQTTDPYRHRTKTSARSLHSKATLILPTTRGRWAGTIIYNLFLCLFLITSC